MINFRFHLISLVAVFLALGIGVAMGASFIDRATVDSLRGRVDALEQSYRRRGAELDAARSRLASSDNQAAALSGAGSRALVNRLSDVPVVLVVTDSVDEDVLDATRTSLAVSGAVPAGTMTLKSSLLESRKADLAAIRQRFGVKGDAPAVSARLASDLGVSLSLLAASPPQATSSSTTTIAAAPSGDVVTTPTDAAGARAYIAALRDFGLVDIADGASLPGTRFPDGTGYRYVLALDIDDDPKPVIEPLVAAVGTDAPTTMTVAESRSLTAAGDVPTTTQDQPARGSTLSAFRRGNLASQVSTVDDLEDSFGRIALVYALAEQRDLGRVGHYGVGRQVTAPFPTIPTR